MTPDADSIADCVLETYEKLPQKRKPRIRDDGTREWVPLAGIVLVKDDRLKCVSLGTGMKCLPSSKLPLANGNVLHDWHAEILAIRAFNRFLLDELDLLTAPPYQLSQFIRRRHPSELTATTSTSIENHHPFTIQEDVKIYMYCSEAPCGDASMELVMSAQEDATPWTTPAPFISSPQPTTSSPSTPPIHDQPNSTEELPSGLRGRSHFAHLGALRYKPSRPDAPPTLSKSCTDKLSHTQSTSLLSSLTSLLISPENAYVDTLVLPSSQFVPAACQRAFETRMAHVSAKTWTGGYAWTPFKVVGTSREFSWSKRAVGAKEKAIASNLSAVYTPTAQQTLIGGVMQGRKQFDPRGASVVCRRSMWGLAAKVAAAVGGTALVQALGEGTYGKVKESGILGARRRVKRDVRSAALKGWVRNEGDDGFGADENRAR
ncbi:unnamed protein product [Periconia digitata]|uniref:A to I editase domain-containing protein n=1 Tax=Periconia digitata TaxID=1303443 RepID=A0A9W4UBW3_9PLEO|nr:unnamed protein product [Periconia digitata]